MNTDEIKKLLDAFYNGETSAEEEKKLFDYLNSNDVDKDLEKEKELFLQMHQPEPIPVPHNLEAKLENLIDNLAEKEQKKSNRKKLVLTWALSAAACIAILFSAGLFIMKQQPTTEPVTAQHDSEQADSLEADEKKALEEGEKALLLLSQNFNKGVKQASKASENIDKANEILNRTLNRNKQ